jgi:ribosomal protein S13
MARIAGVDLPKEKLVVPALQYIYGIGATISKKIVAEAGIAVTTRVKELTEREIAAVVAILNKGALADGTSVKVEGDLRRETATNIKRRAHDAAGHVANARDAGRCSSAEDCRALLSRSLVFLVLTSVLSLARALTVAHRLQDRAVRSLVLSDLGVSRALGLAFLEPRLLLDQPVGCLRRSLLRTKLRVSGLLRRTNGLLGLALSRLSLASRRAPDALRRARRLTFDGRERARDVGNALREKLDNDGVHTSGVSLGEVVHVSLGCDPAEDVSVKET